MPNPLPSVHASLLALPQVLLQSLGLAQRYDDLARALQSLPHPVALHPQPDSGPYRVAADRGLDLVLQCANPEEPQDQLKWGVHSVSLYADTWAGPWPQGLNPDTATAQEVVRLFSPDPDTTMLTPAMVCFTVPSFSEGQQWSVLCVFDAASQRLQSFSLVRVGEWLR